MFAGKKVTTPTKPKPSLMLKFSKNSKFIPFSEEKTEKVVVDMCREALFHLENCAELLTMMYNMPKCPIFNTGNRIKGDMPLSVVDPIIPSACLDITKFITNENYNGEELISYRKLSTSLPPSNTTNNCLLKLDRPNNILKVWYILIEGLISATVVCSKKNQPAALETLFKLLKNVIHVPGTHFGLHCINHLLLPTVQNWLRQIANMNTNWDSVMPNFKQCCGMTTDTIVAYMVHMQQMNANKTNNKITKNLEPVESPEVTFALKQIMLILVECIAQPQEPVARLGASCIRHIILTSGHLLTNNQWGIVCMSLHRACNVSLSPLKQLTYAFNENSNSFYGDLAIVKIAARRDCTVNDNVRLHAMAQQVFLTEQLRGEGHAKLTPKNSSQNLMLIDDRSYFFLIYLHESLNSLNPELYTVRIPHRGLVVGLLAHQILVQIIAMILIQASSDVFQGINSLLLESLKTGSNVCNNKFFLSNENADFLLKSLELSYFRAMQFDSRPGLKFLVQKVSNLDYAANLYKQTTSSWLIKMMSLTEIFFNGAEEFSLKPSDIAIILHNYRTTLNLTLEYDRFVRKIFDMKATWELLLSSYVNHLIKVSDFEFIEDGEISPPSGDIDLSSNNCKEGYAQNETKTTNGSDTTKITCKKQDLNEQVGEQSEIIDKPKPFTFADFKVNSQVPINAGSQSETVLSTFYETDEADGEILTAEEYPVPDEKESSVETTSVSNIIESHLNTRKINMSISEGLPCDKPKDVEPVIPPQPVPPEIEQQRALSICKDTEVQRHCFQNILMAYLELVLTFPQDRFQLISPVLQDGFSHLAETVTDPQLLERLHVFLDKRDSTEFNCK